MAGFYNTVHFHICSICVKLVVSSLTETQYLPTKASGKKKNNSKTLMLKTKFLSIRICHMNKVHLVGYRKKNFLVYKILGVAVEWIPSIRNKAEIIFSSKNNLHYCNSIIRLFCISVVLCSASQSTVQIELLLQLGSIFFWNPQRKRKKLTNSFI